MAVTYKGLTIRFGGDTTGLSAALKKIQAESRTTQASLRSINQALKFNPGNTELLRQKTKALNDAYAQTKLKLDSYKQGLAQLEAKKASGAKLTDAEQKQYDQLKRSIITTESQLKAYEVELQKTNTLYEASQTKMFAYGAKLEALGNKFKAVGTKMQTAGKGLSKYVTLPIAGIGAASVKTAADFDAQMSKVAAISGTTGADFDMLRQKAREMGAKTKFSATEAGQGFEYMAMAGWDAHEMADGLPGVLNLAAASGEDLGTTSDIVTDALTAFGLAAEDSAHFADVLAKASSSSNTNVSMMGETFKYAAPVAGALGYSVEDTSIAIGLMANAGIKATNAGTSLRTLMTNMSKPTASAQKAMDDLGVSLTNSDGSMKSFKEVMDDLRGGFGNMKISEEEFNKSLAELDTSLANGEITQKQYDAATESLMNKAYGAEGALKAQAAASLAGKTGMSGLLAIVNASDEDYNNLVNSINNADGAAGKMAETMQDNLQGQLTKIKSALEELAISVGDTLMPKVRSLADKIQGLVDKFNALSPEQKEAAIKFAGIAAAIGPALFITGKMITTLSTIGRAFKSAAVAIQTMKNAQILANAQTKISTLLSKKDTVATIAKTAATKAATLATKAAAAAQRIMNLVMSANPIMLVVTAIAALVTGLIFFFTKTKTGQKIWKAFTEGLKKAWEKFYNFIKPLIEGLKTAFTGFFNFVKGIGGKIAGAWNTLKDKAKGAFSTIKNAITGKLGEAKNKAVGLAKGIASGLASKWQESVKTSQERWTKIRVAMVNGLQVAKTKLGSIADKIGAKLGFPNLGDKVRERFTQIQKFICNPIKTAKDTIKGIVDKIKGFFKNFKINLPHIKLPHFSINPKGWKFGDLLKGQIPSLGIEWYAKGGAIEPNNPRLVGVGDSHEREWIEPESKLLALMKQAVTQAHGGGINIEMQVNATVTGNLSAYQLGQNIGNGINSVLKQRGVAAIG